MNTKVALDAGAARDFTLECAAPTNWCGHKADWACTAGMCARHLIVTALRARDMHPSIGTWVTACDLMNVGACSAHKATQLVDKHVFVGSLFGLFPVKVLHAMLSHD